MKFRFLRTKRSTRPDIPEQRTLTFMDLPVEIHYCIIAELIKDLGTSFNDSKALRLVCKRFDAIVKPRVYSSYIKPFYDEDPLSNVRQLLTLLSSKPNEQLNSTTTLFVGRWEWLCETRRFIPFREIHLINYIFRNAAIAILYFIPPIISRTMVLGVPLRTFALLRLYVPRTLKFNLPNVSCVVWYVSLNDSKWIISRKIKLLQQFPRLSEVFLVMDLAMEELNHLVDCVSKLHNLRKLGFRFHHSSSPEGWFYRSSNSNHSLSRLNVAGMIIAANPNLTHLEVAYLYSNMWSLVFENIDLAQMLAYVPADFPLKLEHICLSHSVRNLAALAPYIRTLASVDLGDSSMLNELLRQSIFPPTIKLKRIDQHAIEYLDRHPQIISLTIYSPCHESFRSTVLRILSRHSKILTHLGIFSPTLCQCIDQTENELAFLQCTNLKQLVLYHYIYRQRHIGIEKETETLLSVIAQLPNSLTLVVNQIWACEMCSKFCSQSQNPFLRNLASRIVYEPIRYCYSVPNIPCCDDCLDFNSNVTLF
ncbi:hypothetical protein F5887DRAFT_1004422 [Amanita rubescens]|nr:hypothetical protein F5887DRAFT_1004422 [Amanita rubescens]